MKRSIKLGALLAAAAVIVVLGACQTVKGLGSDIHSAGAKTERAINK